MVESVRYQSESVERMQLGKGKCDSSRRKLSLISPVHATFRIPIRSTVKDFTTSAVGRGGAETGSYLPGS